MVVAGGGAHRLAQLFRESLTVEAGNLFPRTFSTAATPPNGEGGSLKFGSPFRGVAMILRSG